MADYQAPPGMDWQVPPAAVAEAQKVGWLNESVQTGEAWLKSQRGASDLKKSIDVIAGIDTALTTASYRSKLDPNRLKRNIREVVGALSELRPMWGYQSDNNAFASQAAMMNKYVRGWFIESEAETVVKDALRWTAATGRGFVRPVYRRKMYGSGPGGIQLYSYGAPSVLPNQLPSSGDWQSAYVVHILEEMPIAMAHGMFPFFQDRLKPASSKFWYSADTVRKASSVNLIRRIFGQARTSNDPTLPDLLLPIRYSHVLDLSINKTKNMIPMGEPGSPWYYEVPAIGSDIYVGEDMRTGMRLFRKADENDARLYPYRRSMISTDDCCMYDGPSFDWHGMVPIASFCLDSWPWEPLGFSLVHDGYAINESLKEIYRGNMDKTRSQLNMALAYDINAVSRKEAVEFDPMQPKARLGFDGGASEGQPLVPVVPPEVLRVEATSLELIRMLEQALDGQMAISDLAALVKARASGSMGDLEKIMEANGPIIKEMSGSMEAPMRSIAEMVKYLVLEYVPPARVMQTIGADNVSLETFDYDPASLVPSHLPGENPERPSAADRLKRARVFADNLRFMILPNSLHEITQMAHKLGLIQLKKAGVKISSQTLAEAWNVPNYGSFSGSTEIEKWESEQEMDLEFAARMKKIAGEEGLLPPPGAAPEGRPPSGKKAPTLKSKDGGTRGTISESG